MITGSAHQIKKLIRSKEDGYKYLSAAIIERGAKDNDRIFLLGEFCAWLAETGLKIPHNYMLQIVKRAG